MDLLNFAAQRLRSTKLSKIVSAKKRPPLDALTRAFYSGVKVQMSIELDSQPRYEKVQMVLLGLVLAGAFFGYGAYALIQASCTLIGRGNPPIGTFVTFYGIEARLLSTIYIGAGICLFAGNFLSKRSAYRQGKILSWVGALTLSFGACSLVVILCLPLFR